MSHPFKILDLICYYLNANNDNDLRSQNMLSLSASKQAIGAESVFFLVVILQHYTDNKVKKNTSCSISSLIFDQRGMLDNAHKYF